MWLPSRLRLRYASKLFVSHMLAVFLISGSVGTFFYIRAMDNMMRSLKSRLQNSAALLSQSINASELEPIRSKADVERPAYLAALEKMRRIRRTNPDIAFLYIMRREGKRITFVVDSDETEAQALPGYEYDEVTPQILLGFHQPSVDEDLVEDEWGIFLSGYAPLLHGEGRYLVGIDMRADEVQNKLAELRLTGLLSLVASILLALLFALYLSRGLTRRIALLSAHCRELALGNLDSRVRGRSFDEFDDLADAFNVMGDKIAAARTEQERAIAELQRARDGLETRVEERTRELRETIDRMEVMRGLLPICSSCKKIRDDQGYWKQLEHFISEHSEARFTHGICPDCTVKLYGKAFDEDKDKKPGL
jgi:methyl-accepting chemotaxis protein